MRKSFFIRHLDKFIMGRTFVGRATYVVRNFCGFDRVVRNFVGRTSCCVYETFVDLTVSYATSWVENVFCTCCFG